MIKRLLLGSLWYAFVLCTNLSYINAQQLTNVSGTIQDATTGETIAGVSIIIKGRVLGTTSDVAGEFNFDVTIKPPFTLVFSTVDYEIREININRRNQHLTVNLRPKSVLTENFVKHASRFGESLLQTPISIEKLSETEIRQLASPDFYSGLVELREVNITSSSLAFSSINGRGFGTTANTRLVQLIDEVDNSLPGFNFAMGNMLGVSELDVAEVELIPGAASALYGPNAFNGILFMNTKNPFDYEGLSAMIRNGVTLQKAAGRNPYGEAAFRFARILTDRVAFKINFSAMRGTDWHATNYTDLNNPNSTADAPDLNTNYDGLNIYGDEITEMINFDLVAGEPQGTFGTHTIARTGYREIDLVDYIAQSYKVDGALHIRVNDNLELIGSQRFATGSSIYHGANRYNFKNLRTSQSIVELKGSDFFIRGYNTMQRTGDAYDTRFAAWNINQHWQQDKFWFGDYTLAYIGGIQGVESNDHTAARAYADRNRIEPQTAEFDVILDSVVNRTGFDQGAKIVDNTSFFHLEGNVDVSDFLQFMEVQFGGSYRQYTLNSEGTIFTDINRPINIAEFGIYTQGKKSILEDKLTLSWALRFDKNQNFEGLFSPRLAFVYSTGKKQKHNLRLSFQSGFRNPTVQNQYLGLNLGSITVLGGVQDNLDNFSGTAEFLVGDSLVTTVYGGNDIYDNAYTAESIEQFSATGDQVVLTKSDYDLLQPEQVTTIELGYKGLINKRLFIDLTFHASNYDNLIGLANVVYPLTGQAGELSGLFDVRFGRTRTFQLFVNANERIRTVGINIGLDYIMENGFRIKGSYNYINMNDNELSPDFIAFNMPPNSYAISLENRNIYKGFGFKATHRWMDQFEWYGQFANGFIEQRHVTSAQITYRIPGTKTILKFGGVNLLCKEYFTASGSPAIGTQYYFSLLFDEVL